MNWCNAAGGINGRKIKFVSRDAQITQAPARIVDACQSDFMLVGGGTPLDEATVAPRLKCGLGTIPAFAISTAAATSGLSAIVFRSPSREANVLIMRRLLEQYRRPLQSIAYTALDSPSFLNPAEALSKAINASGGNSTITKVPLTVTNFRTYIHPLLGHASTLVLPPTDPVGIFRAMTDVGFKPDLLLDVAGTAYNPIVPKGLKAVPSMTTPYYSQTNLFPLQMADQNPATKLAVDLIKQVNPDRAGDPAITLGYGSWVLWAQSATACGNNLTVQCVIDKAKAQKTYDAGGLRAPVDVSDPLAISPCELIQKVTADGFVYDRDLTRPNRGVFNCDPANVVRVGG